MERAPIPTPFRIRRAASLFTVCLALLPRPESDLEGQVAGDSILGGDVVVSSDTVRARAGSNAAPIEGLAELAWRTPLAAVVERRGPPVTRQAMDANATVIAYPDSLAGHPATLVLLFREGVGLIKGLYDFHLADRTRCETVFRDVRGAIETAHPGLRSEEARENGFDEYGEAFCEAVYLGEGTWEVAWVDEAGHAILLQIAPGDPAPALHVWSPDFDAWNRARQLEALERLGTRGGGRP